MELAYLMIFVCDKYYHGSFHSIVFIWFSATLLKKKHVQYF